MGIDSLLFTATAPQPTQATASDSKNALPTSKPQRQGFGSFDTLLTQAQTRQSQLSQVKTAETLQSQNAKLKMTQILATTGIGGQDSGNVVINTSALAETLGISKQALNDIIKPLLQQAGADNGNVITLDEFTGEVKATDLEGLFQAIAGDAAETAAILGPDFAGDGAKDRESFVTFLKKLENLLNNQGDSALIKSELTQQQLEEFGQKIRKISDIISAKTGEKIEIPDELDEKSLSKVIATLLQIIDPNSKSATPPLADANIQATIEVALNGANGLALNKQISDLAKQLNALVVGGNDDRPAQSNRLAINENTGPSKPDAALDTKFSKENFGDALKSAAQTKATPDTNVTSAKATHILPNLSAIESALLGPLSPSDIWRESVSGFTASYAVTGLNNLTNMSTQAQSAGRAHPATQMVAATMQKSMNGGQNKSITLQLDPPELGRVEVRMVFGKDKTLKTTLISEKPETFLMLQRDSGSLERILQDSGLNADSGLSFELAQEGYDFNQNGGHDNHGSHGGKGKGSGDDLETLETTMTWHVDPESGHMRYNLLA